MLRYDSGFVLVTLERYRDDIEYLRIELGVSAFEIDMFHSPVLSALAIAEDSQFTCCDSFICIIPCLYRVSGRVVRYFPNGLFMLRMTKKKVQDMSIPTS